MGGWRLGLFLGRYGSPTDEKGAYKISCQENSFNYNKEALHLCMDVYTHEFSARFISFIDMQIQVQALQNTNMDERITLFELKLGKCRLI